MKPEDVCDLLIDLSSRLRVNSTLVIVRTLLWSPFAPVASGLKLINFFLVHCLGTLEDVATTRISVAADTSQSLLESASIAKGTCHKQVDAIFLNALLSLLQAIVDATHQRFIGHDQAVAVHVSDAGKIFAILNDLKVLIHRLLGNF